MPFDRPDQQVMVDIVEKRLDIKIDRPVVLPATFPAHPDRVQRRPPRAVAIGIRVEDRFDLPLQDHGGRCLRDAVRNARNAQDANTASPGLRYLHGFHRWREVRPRGQPIPQPIQVVFQVLLELLDRLPVHTGRTLVGLDLLVASQTSHFEISNGLSSTLSLLIRFLPNESVDRKVNSRQSAPFAPLPLQEHHRYYEAVRPPAPHRYSAPHGFRRLGLSLPTARRRPESERRGRIVGSLLFGQPIRSGGTG